MVNTNVPAVDIISYANELFVAHDVFVNGPEEEDYSNDPQEVKAEDAPKLIEKLYAAFKLPYPDKTPQADSMLAIINGWLLSYNSNRDNKQERFDSLEALEDASEEFMLWVCETAEFELGK